MSENDIRHLQNILLLADKLIQDIGVISYEDFIHDELLPDACAMKLVAIGEQVNRITDELQEENPQIPWGAIYGLRNRFAHDYFTIDSKMLWDILRNDIGALREQIAKILE
ncbi:hypothetical protein AGMMS50276_31820 [Synergistales bacterium]|nr:hypothetical protein AGMMS50276_31820 [Synergistales bacterium]